MTTKRETLRPGDRVVKTLNPRMRGEVLETYGARILILYDRACNAIPGSTSWTYASLWRKED